MASLFCDPHVCSSTAAQRRDGGEDKCHRTRADAEQASALVQRHISSHTPFLNQRVWSMCGGKVAWCDQWRKACARHGCGPGVSCCGLAWRSMSEATGGVRGSHRLRLCAAYGPEIPSRCQGGCRPSLPRHAASSQISDFTFLFDPTTQGLRPQG